jgi:hypothetical protein
MKTIVGFTMAALATLVLATAADADVQGQRCNPQTWGRGAGGVIGVRAGTPCVILPTFGWRGYATETIEPPHNGTAVLRADGSIYYSPKPGFTGRDHIRVRRTRCGPRYPYCSIGEAATIYVE